MHKVNNIIQIKLVPELRDAIRVFSIVYGSLKTAHEFIEHLFELVMGYSEIKDDTAFDETDDQISEIHSYIIDDLFYNGLNYVEFIEARVDADKKPNLFDRIMLETEENIIQELDYVIYMFCNLYFEMKLYTREISSFHFRQGYLCIRLKEG